MRSWWARNLLARGTVSGGLSGFLRRGRAPVGALWGLRGVGFVVMALRPSFVGLRMPGGGGGRFARPVGQRAGRSRRLFNCYSQRGEFAAPWPRFSTSHDALRFVCSY